MPHRNIASFLLKNTPSMSEVPPDMIPEDVVTRTEMMAEMFDRHMRRRVGEEGYTSGPTWELEFGADPMERVMPGNPYFELDLDNPSPEAINRMVGPTRGI